MSRRAHQTFSCLAVLGLIVTTGCGGGGSGSGSARMTFLVPAGAGAMTSAALTSTDGSGNSLVFDSVEIVLREVEFDAEDGDDDFTAGVANHEDEDCDDDCEEVEIGPLLVSLALDGSMMTSLAFDLLPGSYEKVEFELHPVSSDDDDDDQFLVDHPGFDDISVRVLGTYNGDAFEFTSDVNSEQELRFSPPFEVIEGEPANVTITIDVNSWFRNGLGTLIDPATAGDGGPNESIVEDNIEQSFDAFEDDDRDGDHDDDDDDDDGDDDDEDDDDGDDDDGED